MDMTPPQAPPALESPAHQAAINAFNRLVATRDWLAAQRVAMPHAPAHPDATQRMAYLRAFDAYWLAAARTELASRVGSAMADLAQLGMDDRTLDAADAALVRAFTDSVPGTPRPTLHTRELVLGGKPLAGSIVIEDSTLSARVLLFSSTAGWESFASLDALQEAIAHRVRLHLGVGGSLPGLSRRALGSIATDEMTSRASERHGLATYIDRALAVHRERLDEAWTAWAVTTIQTSRDTLLADSIADELAYIPALDIESLLATRHARLVEAANEERLAAVPADAATAWRQAADVLASATDIVDIATPPAQTLASFATAELNIRLAALGVSAAPADITVVVDDHLDVVARTQSLQALFKGNTPAKVPLLDMAYQNIAAFDPVRLTARDAQGHVIAALDDVAIRALVRDMDLANRYTAYLGEHWQHGEDAGARKAAATALLAARMRLQAEDARLSYYLPSEPRSFRPDHAGRGYHWVKAVLDSPAASGRKRVEGHEVVVRQVTYKGVPVSEVLEIGVRQQQAVPTVVYYTPGAPDGITFREFDDRHEAARRFLYHPAFREYLLDRLPADFASTTPGRSERMFAGDRLGSWVLGQGGTADYTWTAERFADAVVAENVLDRVYDTATQLALRNTRSFTRSATEANWAWLTEQSFRLLLDDPLAGAVKGVVSAPAHAAQAAWRLYDSVKAGDAAQAWVDFTGFYVASLGVAAPGVVSGSAQSLVAASFRHGARVGAHTASRARPALFEPRYEAGNVARRGTADANGVITIDGHRYIDHAGTLYGVRYDTTFETWRLQARDRDPLAWGPAIRHTGGGRWDYHTVGLKGGFDRAPTQRPTQTRAAPNTMFDRYSHAMEQAFPDPFERELVTRTMEAESLGTAPNMNVNLIQRARWIEARANAVSAQGFSDWQQLRLGAPQIAPENLATRTAGSAGLSLPPLPSAFRRVDPAQLPDNVYFYGRLPFASSPFYRIPTQHGYNTHWAHLKGERLANGVIGIPITTIAPQAPIATLRHAVGNSRLSRSSTFAVRIQPASLLRSNTSPPRAELIAMERDGVTRLYLRPLTGENFLRLGNNQQVVPLGREP
ncbi:dermonecrotic toxin domain-containing protein [Luteibacter aegosomatissinici]|uniref:dermonecrotic toxin domain-containing protein n=1 Tax=Luteibacter aegosomatissinici TaxID=2911539 RepID=UPI001FFA326E|nr:DUF6543 domain-containing protein [Luteibacter aegosomatissinici]UPG94853.1 hypothetical protein L2Y97_01745 [Luteibacter aegosomatissinici]